MYVHALRDSVPGICHGASQTYVEIRTHAQFSQVFDAWMAFLFALGLACTLAHASALGGVLVMVVLTQRFEIRPRIVVGIIDVVDLVSMCSTPLTSVLADSHASMAVSPKYPRTDESPFRMQGY